MLKRTLVVPVSLAVTLLLAPSVVAQEPPSPEETAAEALERAAEAPPGAEAEETPSEEVTETVYDTVDVQVVNLTVHVTDGQGRPVTGLAKDDFRLFVDGRPVPISNFYAATEETSGDGRTGGRWEAGAPEEARPEPEAPEEDTEELPGSPDRVNLVFYIDNFNLRPPDRNRVLTALERFVRQEVPPEIRMMLVTYDHSLHVRQDLTTDEEAILDAAFEVRGLSGLAPGTDLRRRRAIDEIEKADTESEALMAVEAYADERRVELTLPMRALADFMEPLGGLPGRTVVVHVSNGLPNRIADELFFLADVRYPRAGARLRGFLYDMGSVYQRIVNAANTAGVSFYTLDAGGLTSFDSLSAAEPGSVFGGSFVVADSIRRSNLQVPLERIAEETGGASVINSNNLERFFDIVATDVTSYYSLGYQAAPGADERYRTVRVEVDRPGVRVRHRHGFRVRSVEERLRDGVLAALTVGASSERFPGPVSVGRASPQGDGYYRVPLSVKIPLASVTLVPGESAWVGRLRLAVQARDQEGGLSPTTIGEALDVRIPAEEVETALGQHITWSVDLLMRPGAHELAVGFVDLVADRIDFTLGRVDVGAS